MPTHDDNPNQTGEIKSIDPAKPETVNLSLRLAPPDAYVYSNVAGVTISPYDVRIHFGEFIPNVDPDSIRAGHENIVSKSTAGIVMPPENAAGLVLLMMRQLQSYEAQFGPIRHPKWREMINAGLKQIAKQAAEKDGE